MCSSDLLVEAERAEPARDEPPRMIRREHKVRCALRPQDADGVRLVRGEKRVHLAILTRCRPGESRDDTIKSSRASVHFRVFGGDLGRGQALDRL